MPDSSPGVSASRAAEVVAEADEAAAPTPAPTVLPQGVPGSTGPAADPMLLLDHRAKGIRKVMITLLVFGIFTLIYLASSMLIPIVAGVLLTLLFKPVVRYLENWRIRPTISAALITMGVLGVLIGAAAAAGGQALQYASDLPSAITELRTRFEGFTEVIGDVATPEAEESKSDGELPVTEADVAANAAAAEGGGGGTNTGRLVEVVPHRPAGQPPTPLKPLVKPPRTGLYMLDGAPEPAPAPTPEEPAGLFGVKIDTLATSVLGVTLPVIMGLVIAVGLMFFMLASGDLFLKKIVQVLPKLSDKKEAVEAAHELERDVSTYLLTVTLINIALGVVMFPILWWLDMPNAWLWAVLAGLMNYVPYIGPVVYEVVLLLVGLLFWKDNWQAALLPPLAFAVVNTMEAYVVTPTIMGKRFELNPVVVFVWLVIWGWLWGIAGALLAVPMLVVFRIMAYHIPMLQPIGDFIAEEGSSQAARAQERRVTKADNRGVAEAAASQVIAAVEKEEAERGAAGPGDGVGVAAGVGSVV